MARSKKPLQVGWLFASDLSAVVYFPPERLEWPPENAVSRGAADCPAIADLGRHYYVIRSPFTLHLRCTHFVPGAEFFYDVSPLDGGDKVLTGATLSKVLAVMPPTIWESPNYPTLQLHLPYTFVSDESVYIEQLPAFYSPVSSQWPIMLYGGRFPIDIWPRQLNFSFQWVDLTRPLLIRRGDPLFYVRFFPEERDRKIQLLEALRTRELESFMASVRDVTAVVSRSFSLFSRAAEMRPKRLVVPRESYLKASRDERADRKRGAEPPEDEALVELDRAEPGATF